MCARAASECDCAGRFDVWLGRPHEYARFKRLLDVGRHPAFIGREMYARMALNGGAMIYRLDGEDVAASLVNPHHGVLLALNVHPNHRSHGLGAAIMAFLVPNFARVTEDRVAWFERRGYVCVGSPKVGRALKTQIMARQALFGLAGRLKEAWG